LFYSIKKAIIIVNSHLKAHAHWVAPYIDACSPQEFFRFLSRSFALPLHQRHRYISVPNTIHIIVIITFTYVTLTEMQRLCNGSAKLLLQITKKLLLAACAYIGFQVPASIGSCAFKLEFTVFINKNLPDFSLF
jgi:hypothetical protein